LSQNGSPASRWDWSVEGVNTGTFGANSDADNGFVMTDMCIDFPVSNPYPVTRRVAPFLPFLIGGTTTYGIEMVGGTTSHEIFHQTLYNEIHQAGNVDTDGDRLADIRENVAPEFFIVGGGIFPDTWQCAVFISATYANYGDNEVIAREAEPAGVATVNLNEDWSVDGAQWDH
jgi:hypothetical protein